MLTVTIFMQHSARVSGETTSNVVMAGVTAKSPWTKVPACQCSISDVMCQVKNLVSTFGHWKVKHIQGEAGSEINQSDPCLDQQNSDV